MILDPKTQIEIAAWQNCQDPVFFNQRQIQKPTNPNSKSEPQKELHKLKETCQQFEAIFLNEILKSARAATPPSGLLNSDQAQKRIWEQYYDESLAEHLATSSSGIGLGDLLYNQLKVSLPEHIQNEENQSEQNSSLKEFPKLQSTHDSSILKNHDDLFEQSLIKPNLDLNLPVDGEISSSYGWRKDPIDDIRRFHHGLDIAATKGSPVTSLFDGKVVFSGWLAGYGRTVILKHENGYQTLYAHLSSEDVKAGEEIKAGQVLGTVGSSGRSTGPHLHYEIHTEDGNSIDPLMSNSLDLSV